MQNATAKSLNNKHDDIPLEEPLPENMTEAARYMKALSHPIRLAILSILAHQAKCVNKDIIKDLPISRSTAFQHLKVLEKAGLIKSETNGANTLYCVDRKKFVEVKSILLPFFDLNIPDFNCSC